MLGQREPFFHKIVATLDAVMGDAYPSSRPRRPHRQGARAGRTALRRDAGAGHGAARRRHRGLTGKQIPARRCSPVRHLWLPVDLTNDVARERGLTIDEAASRRRWKRAQSRARREQVRRRPARRPVIEGHRVQGLRKRARAGSRGRVDPRQGARRGAARGEEGQVVLDATPFYAESAARSAIAVCSPPGWALRRGRHAEARQVHLHVGRLEGGSLKVVTPSREVDHALREATRRNHSAPTCCTPRCARCLGSTSRRRLAGGARPAALRLLHYSAVTLEELREIERW